MTTVFIAGSISIRRLHNKIKERIEKIVSSGFNVVVGDADGADTAIQQCLLDCHAIQVTIYCTSAEPRNNVAGWPVHRVVSQARPGSRQYYTAKDIEMARASDYGLMIWDCKSTGTLSNVIELIKNGKKSVVFVNKNKEFLNVSGRTSLDSLIALMSSSAREKAETKIRLTEKLETIEPKQFSLDMMSNNGQSAPTSNNEREIPFFEENTHKSDSDRLRSEILEALREYMNACDLNQTQAAKIFGVTQRDIADVSDGDFGSFSLDELVNMAFTAGLRVELRVEKTT